MRLFIAILLNRELKNVLLNAIDDLRAISRSGRFTSEENLHQTLVFIGEADRRQAEEIKNILRQTPLPAVSITLEKIGRFRRNEGDLYWAGLQPDKAISDYVGRLTEKLLCSGFSVDDRPYVPHITLGRGVRLLSAPDVSLPGISMPVSAVSLMKSERINGKLTYTEIFRKETI